MTLSDPGSLIFIFVLAVPLSWCASWLLAARYRAALKRLMSIKASPLGPPVAGTPAAPVPIKAEGTAHAAVSLGGNRRAGRTLTTVLMLLSFAMALSRTALDAAGLSAGQLAAGADPEAVSFWSILKIAPLEYVLAFLWPTIPAMGLLWRWRVWQILGATLAYGLLCFAVSAVGMSDPISAVQSQALIFGVPLVLVGLLCLAPTTRAIAPWLLPLFLVLLAGSVAGSDLLVVLNKRDWLDPLYGAIGGIGVVVTFYVLLPWLLAWWPTRLLGRALARAYARRWVSETMVLFTAVWSFGLLWAALQYVHLGWIWFVIYLLPLGWIPPVMFLYRRLLPASENRPPLLLVLRVFQHDREVQHLFDDVIERWRLSGNTALIAGTDLLDRTVNADDIFTFLDGGLARRFIWRAEEIPTRLAGFDLEREIDGRFRVNKCYCHDSTWQDALAALAQRCDVALMDLRGFQAHNAGCVYELGVLARGRARVVALTDSHTDKAAAQKAAAGAPDEQFIWLQTGEHSRGRVLQALFDAMTGCSRQ
jgi:hypothetical protein